MTSESFSVDAMSIEYEDDDGASDGDAVVGPHDDEDDDDAAAGDAVVGPHDDSNGSLDNVTRRSSKTSSTSR